ncbi:GLPGLI family protein [Flavobacterium salilacus subsp. salilacus]|uniref:GLPGLI family protein n=1 Tax=Flavobacterium TaxID=237 RepID=UPI0010751AE4|nr:MULTISPECIES: GLPGLI family protein [Flavobacterium]KAF2515457.1 GLPGLI family protein [Flavobacterium salilacus subsp. salilacus]MBE1615855.1 GLPGLI family protein [Flavobacterium sp. SaA2.13]
MRSIYIIAFLILFGNLFYGQTGTITYSATLDKNSGLATNEITKKYYQAATENIKDLKFELLFNKDKSIFIMDETAKLDTRSYDAIKSFIGYYGSYYQEKMNLYKLIKKMLPEDYLVKTDIITNWDITKTSKVIKGYKCFKATTPHIVDGKQTGPPIVAWYCPELPYNFGPNGISGLPGLILEVQKSNQYLLTVSDIKIGTVETQKVKKPIAFKEVSETEFNKQFDEHYMRFD